MTAKAEVQAFVKFYSSECERTGFKPNDQTTRDQRVRFLSETLKKFCSKILVMKRASPSRPVSDEAVVSVLPNEYRLFWDFIISGGSAAWKLQVNGNGEDLPTDQPLVNPLDLSTLTDPVSVAPTVPGCAGPTPQPPANTVPYHGYDGDGKWNPVSKQLRADYKRAHRELDDNCGMWFGRTIHDAYMGQSADKPPLTVDASIAKHRVEWCAELGIPVE